MRVRGCVCGRVRVCAKCVLGMYTAPSARTWSQCPALARPLFSRSDEPVRSRIRAWAWKKVSSIRGSCGRITASERCRFSRRPSQASSTQPAQRCAGDWGHMRPSLPFLAPTVTTSPPETDPRLRLAWECFRCLAQRPSQASLAPPSPLPPGCLATKPSSLLPPLTPAAPFAVRGRPDARPSPQKCSHGHATSVPQSPLALALVSPLHVGSVRSQTEELSARGRR